MGIRCELTPLDMSIPMTFLQATIDYFMYIKAYVVYLKDLLVAYVKEEAFPFAKYVAETVYVYVKDEYKFVANMVFFSVVVYMLTNRQRTGSDKWYHTISSDDQKRVKRVTGSGYAIMACKMCEATAVYGSFRGAVPEACFDHRGVGMVKAFGCSIDSCNKKCVRGRLFCRSHDT